MRKALWLLAVAIAAAFPAIALRLLGAHPDETAHAIRAGGMLIPAPLGAAVFGVAVLAGAFLISWAAELLQFDVSRNLATAMVALLAVLPEYTVDMYLTWTAVPRPENTALALANMTGANRLLIGLGWPAIAFAVLWTRKRGFVRLERDRWGEVFFLAAATIYAFLIPIKRSLTLVDSVVFLAIFAFYLRYVIRQEIVEPEIEGPAEVIGRLRPALRRAVTLALFVYAGAVLFCAAEPFAEGLKLTGKDLGLSEFLLIQWLAPLASEAPEFLIVMIFALRGQAAAGFGTLVSSKVNQWTLLVGMVPIVYALSSLAHGAKGITMPLDPRQIGELLLTAAQSYMALAIVLNRTFTLREATWLVSMFVAQLGAAFTIEEWVAPAAQAQWFAWEKGVFTAFYIVVGTAWLVHERRWVPRLLRVAFPARAPGKTA